MANYEEIPDEDDGPNYLDYSASAKNNYYDSEYAGSDNYMEASGTYMDDESGYLDGPEEPVAKESGAKELPDFLKQDQMQRKLLEAQKTKAFHMKYHESPLLPLMKEKMHVDWDPPTGSWNERFQILMDMDDSYEKYDNLRSTAHDFVHAAEAYGRIIISEMCLPDTQKTIKPTAVGGIAGGEKYIVQDILFKFATDFEGLYGGDAFAMKAAGHDISGLMAYLGAIETRPIAARTLHVPLMALIDFRGYRLVAICLLPIGRDTICYGSFDAGKTVHHEFAECNDAMKEIGELLNIKGHRSALYEYLIYAPIDIEAHKGRDGKFYVLDFARYMPPQPPSGKWGGTLYELLRPELVMQSPVPLSPDAFSSFGHQSDFKEDRQAIRDIFKKLKKEEEGGIIFDYAKLISSSDSQSEINENSDFSSVEAILSKQELLVRELHSRGINMRFLGLLRCYTSTEKMRLFLLAECLARLWKSEIRHLWRDTMKSEVSPSQEPFSKITCAFLNQLLKPDSAYWESLSKRLMEKFPSCLSASELEETVCLAKLYDGAFFRYALPRLLLILNIELEPSTRSALLDLLEKSVSEISKFEFVPGDILAIGCRTKHISTVDKADAYAYMYPSQALKSKPETAARMLNLAVAKLMTAMKTNGNDFDLQYRFCFCRVQIFKLDCILKRNNRDVATLCSDALESFISKVGKLPNSPLVSSGVLLHSRFKYYAKKFKILEKEDALSFFYTPVLRYKAYMKEFYESSEAKQPLVLPGIYDYLEVAAKILYLFTMQDKPLAPSSGHDTLQNYGNGLRDLFDDFSVLYGDKEFLKTHAMTYGWLWWLLTQYGRFLIRTEENHGIPVEAAREMISDANQFIVDGLSTNDSKLEKFFLKATETNTMEDLVALLPIAGASEYCFATISKRISDWTSLELSDWTKSLSVAFPDVLGKLIVSLKGAKKLNFRKISGLSEEAMLLILNSPSVQASVECLKLPAMPNGYQFLEKLDGQLPALQTLSVRSTGFRNSDLVTVLKFCPNVSRLILSACRIKLEPGSDEALWLKTILPKGLKKLDMGFPESLIEEDEFLRLLGSGVLDSLEFLGLASTQVSEISLVRILELDHLQSLDIAGCQFIQSVAARVLCSQPKVFSCFKEVWLPDGSYFPLLQHLETVEYSISRAGGSMSVRGKKFCELTGRASDISFRPVRQDTCRRSLHKECSTLEYSPEVWSVFYQFNRVPGYSRYGERNGKFTSFFSGPVSSYVQAPIAARMGLSKAGVLTFLLAFEGQNYSINAHKDMAGKVQSISIKNTESLETITVSTLAPRFGGSVKKVTFKSFAKVSPAIMVAICQILSIREPTAAEHLTFG